MSVERCQGCGRIAECQTVSISICLSAESEFRLCDECTENHLDSILAQCWDNERERRAMKAVDDD